jgi:hypothetical protein
VIVFLVANSGGGGTGGTDTAQSPGSQPSVSGSAPKTSGQSSNSNVSAELGKTPTEGRISNFSSAGKLVIDYFGDPAAHWDQLTPAAQQVYGDEQGYQQYWAENKKAIGPVNTAKADSGGSESDGSLVMNVNVAGGRPGYRLVVVGGQTLIDANTKIGAATTGY